MMWHAITSAMAVRDSQLERDILVGQRFGFDEIRGAHEADGRPRITWVSRLGGALLTASMAFTPTVARMKCRLRGSRVSTIVHVIGDSHVNFFSGEESIFRTWRHPSKDAIGKFRTYWLGPALAYNLPDLGTTVRAREKLFWLLAFGEIDCRFHLLKQAEFQHRHIEELVCECAQRYADVVREVQALGFRPLVWNVVPTGQPLSAEESNPQLPHWGEPGERNLVSRRFNDAVSAALEGSGVPVVTIFDALIGSDGLALRDPYYVDAVHLGQRAMPLAMVAVEQALGRTSYCKER